MNYSDVKIVVNGYELPDPVSIEPELSDLDSDTTVRSIVTGKLNRNVIRSNMIKLVLKFGLQDMGEVTNVLSHLPTPSFTVNLFDPVVGKRVTKTMYVGNRKFTYKVVGKNVMIDGLTFSLIEV